MKKFFAHITKTLSSLGKMPLWSKSLLAFGVVAIIGVLLLPKTTVAVDVLNTSASIADFALAGIIRMVSTILWLIMQLTSLILVISGYVLDLVVNYSIVNFANFVSGSGSIVGFGWTVVRDLSNMVFIFLILWIAISTILGLGHGTMKSVLRIVIAAILINFSLFITKAVIDSSNILALHFFNLLTGGGSAGGSLSAVFMEGMKVQTFFNSGILAPGSLDLGNMSRSGIEIKFVMMFVLGSIAMLVSSWIFLSAAVMFLIRMISLLLLMILSPLAFIAWVVPGFAGMTKNWWHKLFSQAFFAPVFMLIVYIVGKAIQSGALNAISQVNPGDSCPQTAGNDFSSMITSFTTSQCTPDVTVVGVVLNFALVIGLLIGALIASQKMGAAGASTMIHWGNHIRGNAQGWLGTRTVGAAARKLDERFEKSYLGNTNIGKTLREWTTIQLKDSKMGGHMSAEQRHKEDLELQSKQKEAMEVSGRPFDKTFTAMENLGKKVTEIANIKIPVLTPELAMQEGHNAKVMINNLEVTKAQGKKNIAEQEAIVENFKKEVEKDPTNTTLQASLARETEKLKEIKQVLAQDLEKGRGDLQKILVTLTPHSFVEMMPKEMLFTPEVMRNASRAQFNAVMNSDHFAEVEKDKFRAARYSHIKEAQTKVKEANADYADKYKQYTDDSQIFVDSTDRDTKVSAILDRMGLALGSLERNAKHNEIYDAIDKYENHSFSEEEKKKNLEEGLEKSLGKAPVKKTIGDVAPDVRTWIRAMADQEIDEMYRFDPKMVADTDVTSTIRSSAIRYARGSENIASIDKDGFRDAKLRPIIDASDLVNGYGKLAPSYETFIHMVTSMVKNGAKEVEHLTHMSADDFKKYQGGSNESLENWEKLKEDYLRKAGKKIALSEGNRRAYLDSFNNEQKVMASLGDTEMISALGGQSNDEYPLLRGARWRDPAFAEYMDRGTAREFRGKDTSDIKEVMDMVLYNLKTYLENDGKKISMANMDLLHWVATETAGKEFIKRDQISPELLDVYDKMQSIFGKIGRGGKPTYDNFEQARRDLGI